MFQDHAKHQGVPSQWLHASREQLFAFIVCVGKQVKPLCQQSCLMTVLTEMLQRSMATQLTWQFQNRITQTVHQTPNNMSVSLIFKLSSYQMQMEVLKNLAVRSNWNNPSLWSDWTLLREQFHVILYLLKSWVHALSYTLCRACCSVQREQEHLGKVE